MKEADFVRLLLKNLKGIFHRNHGGRFGVAGLPDIEGCFSGRSVIIECKMGNQRGDRIRPKTPITNLQRWWLEAYYSEGAFAFVAIYLEDSKKFVLFEISKLKIGEPLSLSNRFRDLSILIELFNQDFLSNYSLF